MLWKRCCYIKLLAGNTHVYFRQCDWYIITTDPEILARSWICASSKPFVESSSINTHSSYIIRISDNMATIRYEENNFR